MYQVYLDDLLIHDPSNELILVDPKLTLECNYAGSLEFSMAYDHPGYNALNIRTGRVYVYKDGEEYFEGQIIDVDSSFYMMKSVYCEGELSYLRDSIQRAKEYNNITPRRYLEELISIHNSQVEADKRFGVGAVTVTNSTDNVYRYSNYQDTLTTIKDRLVSRMGGYLDIRKSNGVRYLDYIEDYARTSGQTIEFGQNLLDFSQTIDGSEIATAIIPLGAKLEDGESIGNIEERLTIETVNDGVDYIFSEEAVKIYGWITQVVTWDDVYIPANLLAKAKEYLENVQFEKLVLECNAVDLHDLNVDIDEFRLGDSVRVISQAHGLDRFFPVTKLVIYLNEPDRNLITLGAESKSSLSDRIVKQNTNLLNEIEKIPSKSSILQDAINNATELINRWTTGHVVTRSNEILIMDTDDADTARNLWRWNLGGLGFSENGYAGPYDTAITMDGGIVGKFIVAGSISASKLDISYRESVDQAISDAYKNALSEAIADADVKLKSYYTSYEVETKISNTAREIRLEAIENYTALTEVIWDAVEETERSANRYTDDKIKYFVTTAELDSALTIQSQNINAYVSANYTTYAYSDQKYAEAVAAANGNTNAALANYVKITELRTELDLTEKSITAYVQGNYTTYTYTDKKYDDAITTAKNNTTTALTEYVKLSQLRSELALTESSINAYVQEHYATYSYTDKKYQEALDTTTGQIDKALADYVTEVTLKSQLEILSSQITLSVSQSYVTKSSFTTTVSNLEASIKVNANNIALKVSEGNVSSQLSVEPGTVSIGSNRLIVDSTNFKLSGTGQVTSNGAFTSVSGYNQSQLTGGRLYFYYNGTRIGDITASAGASSGTGTVLGIGGDQRGIIMALSNTYYYVLNGGFNPGGNSERHVWSGSARFLDTMYGVNAYFERTNFITASYRSSINAGMYGTSQSLSINTSSFVYGNFGVQGTKNRIVETTDYGHVAMNALESAGAFFADFGSGIISESGMLHVFFEPKFLQTIDNVHQYIIQYAKIGGGAVDRIEKHRTHFVVYGEAGTEFDWAMYAKQKGYASTRMDHMNIPEIADSGAAQELYETTEQRRQDVLGSFNNIRSEREKEIEEYVLYTN